MKPNHLFTLLLLIGLLTACAEAPPTATSQTPLPPGNVERGAVLFASAQSGLPSCASCHAITAARGAGPGVAGYGEAAGRRRPGENAQIYTVNSILNPGSYLVPGYSNLMPGNYGSTLTMQDVSDLTAYLLGL